MNIAATVRRRSVQASIPLFRAAIRYAPGRRWREQLWWRVVEPYVCWEPHSFVARTRFGSRVAGNTSEILQQHVYYFGAWEPDLTAWIEDSLEPGDVLVDVGANAGYFSLLGSRLVGDTGAVVAVEASPRAYAFLSANLSRHRARNIRAVNVAASGSRGTIALFAGSDAHLGVASAVQDQGAGVEAEVDAAPLDDILTPDEMRRTRLVKIDVEGAEWSVLAGMDALFEHALSSLELVIEVHPEHLRSSGRTVGDLIERLADRGFRPYRLEVDYSASAYLAGGRPGRPARISGPIEHQAHLVFSRRDQQRI